MPIFSPQCTYNAVGELLGYSAMHGSVNMREWPAVQDAAMSARCRLTARALYVYTHQLYRHNKLEVDKHAKCVLLFGYNALSATALSSTWMMAAKRNVQMMMRVSSEQNKT